MTNLARLYTGGWGDPFERDPEMVLDDVRNERIGSRRAPEVYGMAIDAETMRVDMDETRRLRRRPGGELIIAPRDRGRSTFLGKSSPAGPGCRRAPGRRREA